jgi:hypothetical protein
MKERLHCETQEVGNFNKKCGKEVIPLENVDFWGLPHLLIMPQIQ